MPAKSASQYGAMAAAAAGKSTLGIPKSVGEEMVHKTPAKKRKKFAKTLAGRRRRRDTRLEPHR
ncbi:MAG: hypothetical protein GY906_30145 [bacterium]|nr:hypothetical protein [bacterium]